MFSWITNCCTPDLRKHPSSGSSRRRRIGIRSTGSDDALLIASGSSVTSSGKPTPPEPLFKEQVRVLSYNIFMRPNNPIRGSTEYQDIRADLFIEHVLPSYDIVCLQEMFTLPLSSRRHEFLKRAQQNGFFWSHASSRSHSFSPSIDGGLVILSRYPILRRDTMHFSSAAFADWYASKGVIYTLIQVGPRDPHFLHVFCTHLQATYDETGREVSERVRREQVEQIVSFINKCVFNRDEWPILICGDLNVQCRKSGEDGSDSDEYIQMMNMLREGLGLRGELVRDLAKEIDGRTHPVTYGDAHFDNEGNVKLKEVSLTDVTTLTQSRQWCNQSLDKVFYIPAVENLGKIEPQSTIINPIYVSEREWDVPKTAPLTHLSDHYAVESVLRVDLE